MPPDFRPRSAVTHTLLVLGDPTTLLFVDERSGETTTYHATRDDLGLRIVEQPTGDPVRLAYASGRMGRPRPSASPEITLQEVQVGSRYHLHRGESVWGVDRLGASALRLQACGTADQVAIRESEQPVHGTERVFDVWVSAPLRIGAVEAAISAAAAALTLLLLRPSVSNEFPHRLAV